MTLPDDTVRCEAGDHLLQRAGGSWRVFLVQDYVALTRLVVLKRGDEPVGVIEEMPDAVPPRYTGVHLLLTTYQRDFESREAARAAIAGGALGAAVENVCRALTDFPAATTEVVRRAAVAEGDG